MQDLFSVKGDIALVTGASSGIGKHFALTLAKSGAAVILVGRDQSRLEQVEEECRANGVKTLAIVADISQSQEISRIIQESKKHFPRVDILINAAGMALRKLTLAIDEEQWDSIMNTNLKGIFLLSQQIAQWMIETKTAGRMINISSSAAFHITPTRTAYSASKIAVESITRSLALSLVEHGIRVNCIAPGFFITEMTESYLHTDIGQKELMHVPMQRAAQVKELEGVLLLLASQASSYMTGSILHVDGGFAISKV